jgi:hypothetical protein
MVDIKFLIEAIQTNNIELVKDLVEKQGADINYFDGSTKNPLFQSIFDKNEEILEYLLSKGANPNIRTKGFGKTPLYEALSGRFDKGVEILLKYHADPNIYDKAYVSPLRLGLRSPNQMILKKLLDAGAKDTTINSVFDFIKSPDVIDLLASYNITPQNNQLIDLQKQRNVYFYKNEYITATLLPSVIILSSKNEEVIIKFSSNLVDIDTKGFPVLSEFMICMGIAILFEKKLINENLTFTHNKIPIDIHILSKKCEKFKPQDIIQEQKRIQSISRNIKRKLIKPDKIGYHMITIKGFQKNPTIKRIFEHGKVEGDHLKEESLLVPKIVHSEFIYNHFIQQQRNYINSLPLLDQLTIMGYTHHGDVLINNYINGTFNFESMEINSKKWKSKIFPFTSQLMQLFGYTEYDQILSQMLTNQQWYSVFDLFIKDLQRIIEKSPPIEHNMIVFRGLSQEFSLRTKQTTQFNSTTLDLNTALDFINYDCCLLQITILKGSHVLYINSVSNYPEQEVIINIGSKYFIKGESFIDRIKTTNITLIS